MEKWAHEEEKKVHNNCEKGEKVSRDKKKIKLNWKQRQICIKMQINIFLQVNIKLKSV